MDCWCCWVVLVLMLLVDSLIIWLCCCCNENCWSIADSLFCMRKPNVLLCLLKKNSSSCSRWNRGTCPNIATGLLLGGSLSPCGNGMLINRLFILINCLNWKKIYFFVSWNNEMLLNSVLTKVKKFNLSIFILNENRTCKVLKKTQNKELSWKDFFSALKLKHDLNIDSLILFFLLHSRLIYEFQDKPKKKVLSTMKIKCS